ncbi:MAG: serine protease [Candidatus Rokuibacteriota bacterium]|nr:MAG: serine protease [Candidatus Rokubacteria bacterium]
MDLGRLADNLRRITVEVTSAGNAVGAGVVWAPGWIVTNAHVIRHPRVAVRFADGRREDGVLVAGDRTADLAVLRVPDVGLPAAVSDESDTLRVGSLVVAIGHPFGMRGALTAGIVHALGPITAGGRPWIQTDLRLAPGNSGGPLADARGCLRGLNAMIVGNLALAIPLSEVRCYIRAAGGPSA